MPRRHGIVSPKYGDLVGRTTNKALRQNMIANLRCHPVSVGLRYCGPTMPKIDFTDKDQRALRGASGWRCVHVFAGNAALVIPLAA